MKKHILLTMLPLSILFGCCKNNDSDDVKITFSNHEEVIANNEYYFTCYINDEFWHSRPPRKEDNEYFDWETSMEFDNSPTHMGSGNFGILSISADRYPDRKNSLEKNFTHFQRLTFGLNTEPECPSFDEIPFVVQNYQSSSYCIIFDDNFHETNTGDTFKIYHQISDFNFSIDSAHSYERINGELIPSSTGWTDVVWGRFNGTFSNGNGDIIQITNGKFKLLEGTWSQLY